MFVGKSDLDVLIAYLGAHSTQAVPTRFRPLTGSRRPADGLTAWSG